MQPAPDPYYLEHFMRVLRSVESRYGFLLSDREREHIRRLHGLSLAARMLYARIANRKGPCFRVDKLHYPELPALDTALTALQDARLLQSCEGPPTSDDVAPLLRCFTLPELTAALQRHGITSPRRRGELLVWLAQWPGQAGWLADMLDRFPVIRLADPDIWAFLRFLFFGELRDNLSDFVVHELGFLTPEDIAPHHLAIRFASRAEAVDAFRMARLYAEFRIVREAGSAGETLVWWQGQGIDRSRLAAGQDILDRLIDRLGRRLERAQQPALALSLYASNPNGMTRDRQARLLIKEGRRAEAADIATAMTIAPHNTQEAYAGRHLLEKLTSGRRISDARRLQKMGRVVNVARANTSVESATLAHYRRLGWDGVHGENWLWNAAFGLLLWDIIYDPGLGTFHSPLQTAPSDLYDRDFYLRRQTVIEQRLAQIQDRDAAQSLVRTTFYAKRGLTNPFVPWQDDVLPIVQMMIDRLPADGLAKVLRRLAQDIRNHARGFPDLFLWQLTDYCFVEVKSETDQLSPAQYEWLSFFKESGICIHIDNIRQI